MLATIEAWIARRATMLAAAAVVLFVAGALTQSYVRPFWNDEYFTLAIAEQPTVAAAIQAVEKGVDLNPPLFHIATRVSTRLVGLNRVGMRLPAVLGFAVMMCGIFLFVSRALPGVQGRICALAAMILPVLTGLEYYGSEGRPYGMVLGFVSLAIVAWQPTQRGWGLSLLTGLLLACAVLSHSYAIFALGPFLLAELVRYRASRQWRLGFVFAMSVLPILAFGIAVQLGRKGIAVNASGTPASLWDIELFYTTLLQPLLPVLAMLFLFYAALCFLKWLAIESDSAQLPLRTSELTLAISLFLLPWAVIPLSRIAKLPFYFRYNAVAGIGFVFLVAFLLLRLRRWRSWSLVALLALLAVPFVFHETWMMARFARYRTPIPDRPSFVDPEAQMLPAFAQDPYLYVEMMYTWPVARRANLHYALDVEMSRRMVGPTNTEMNVAQLINARPVPMQVETYAELRAKHRPFLLYYDAAMNRDEIKGWLLKRLLDDGVPVQLIRRHGDIFVYLVNLS